MIAEEGCDSSSCCDNVLSGTVTTSLSIRLIPIPVVVASVQNRAIHGLQSNASLYRQLPNQMSTDLNLLICRAA